MTPKVAKRNGLPGYADNTWQAGIERLLLGYAMPGNGQAMFSDILPYDHIEGGEAQILGRFLEFLSQLFELVRPYSITLFRRQPGSHS